MPFFAGGSPRLATSAVNPAGRADRQKNSDASTSLLARSPFLDVDSGFTFAGAVEHPSEVRRSVRVNDALYSISHDTLKVNSIENPNELLGQIYYLPPANGGVVPKAPKADDIDGAGVVDPMAGRRDRGAGRPTKRDRRQIERLRRR